jgi:ABC-type dipeptide/oligopeptide/nickel transport system permease subunit
MKKRVRQILHHAPLVFLISGLLAAAGAHFFGSKEIELSAVLCPPTSSHPWGCDAFGRDLFLGTLRGAWNSVGFALAATATSLVLGIATGLVVAQGRDGRGSPTLESLLAGVLAFPSLLLALAWSAARGGGFATLLGALVLGSFPGFARLVLVRARELKSTAYLEASQAAGASPFQQSRRHLLPACLELGRAKAPALFAQTLLAEATLSFLGVGAPLGTETWGRALAQGRDYLIEAPHIALASGIPLVITVLCAQLLADQWDRKSLAASRDSKLT